MSLMLRCRSVGLATTAAAVLGFASTATRHAAACCSKCCLCCCSSCRIRASPCCCSSFCLCCCTCVFCWLGAAASAFVAASSYSSIFCLVPIQITFILLFAESKFISQLLYLCDIVSCNVLLIKRSIVLPRAFLLLPPLPVAFQGESKTHF